MNQASQSIKVSCCGLGGRPPSPPLILLQNETPLNQTIVYHSLQVLGASKPTAKVRSFSEVALRDGGGPQKGKGIPGHGAGPSARRISLAVFLSMVLNLLDLDASSLVCPGTSLPLHLDHQARIHFSTPVCNQDSVTGIFRSQQPHFLEQEMRGPGHTWKQLCFFSLRLLLESRCEGRREASSSSSSPFSKTRA